MHTLDRKETHTAAFQTSTEAAHQTVNDLDQDYLWNRRHQLRVRVLSNLLYQQERQAVMDLRDRAAKAGTLIAGTAVFAQWTMSSGWLKSLGALVGIFSLISFVFAFSAKAQDAAKRAGEWNALNGEIEKAGERTFDDEMLNNWYARVGDIERGEPAANKALFQQCYERACLLLGGEATHRSEGRLRAPNCLRFIA